MCVNAYVYKYVCLQTLVFIDTHAYMHMWIYVQPIPLGVTFSNAVSKLKAQSSNVSVHWNVAKETFELWAVENVTPSGICCIVLDFRASAFDFRIENAMPHMNPARHTNIWMYVCIVSEFCNKRIQSQNITYESTTYVTYESATSRKCICMYLQYIYSHVSI